MNERGEILLVDDDGLFRAILCEVLTKEGCSVRQAANGREALEMVDDHIPDVILTDLTMPVMDGWDLCAELARDARLAGVPVVVVSGLARTRPLGVRGLTKPVQLAELLVLLETLLPA
jgi:CheY-like chemotaxis protein